MNWKVSGIALAVLVCFVQCQVHEVVNTKYGKVKGIVSKYDKGNVYQFLKIPFAQPPTGNLRFRKPVPINPWNDVIDATEHPPSCVQPMLDMFTPFLPNLDVSEDCLFLSIYVPKEMSSASKKSVMVWIHGGGYHIGQANMYDGSYLALAGDVIVVTLNYRLNVFGFMTTWNSVAMGNYGFWDQIFALRWVKENIEDFGGDPESITIFGESAGGFSVSLLSLIPNNEGLFHRVIAQSGSAVSPMAYNNKYKSHIEAIIKDVECDSDTADSSAIIECLRQVPADKLVNITNQIFFDGIINDMVIPFGPRTDNELFPDSPPQLIDQTSPSGRFFRSVDYMTGFTSGEGIGSVSYIPPAEDGSFNISEGMTTKYLCNELCPKIAKSMHNGNTEISDAICKVYSLKDGDTPDIAEQARKAVDLEGDITFGYAAIDMLNAHVEGSRSTYKYVFSRPLSSILGQEFPSWFDGSPHGTDIFYVFGIQHLADVANITINDDDLRLADDMMMYWTNFAKTGNPNGDSLLVWPKYTPDKMEYMDLNLKIKTEAASDYFKDRMKLWLHEIPAIENRIKTSQREEL